MKILIRAFFVLLCSLFVCGAMAEEVGRVIVKYRSNSSVLLQGGANGSRAQALSNRLGQSISRTRTIAPRMDVVHARNISSETLAARLAAQTDVEYAVPDLRKSAKSLPNDPLFSSQWYLQATEPAAINALGAWDLTTGLASVVVAVIDGGIRPEHPDLKNQLFYTRSGTVYGYDFVSDPVSANDGDARDSDPTDPGDWVTSAEAATDAYRDCGVVKSGWHGTQVASIIAAETNNSTGIAGVAWNSRIVPVRVLGKCGEGYDSDIIAGMRWAAGLSVNGVPANTHPARIINLSLGGAGTCSAAYQEAIDEITAAGTLVVAAAGNKSGAVVSPGNCPGVLAVAGIRHTGTKVGYSSYGTEVGISAPAGNCVNATGNCLYPILAANNSGTSSAASSTYTDSTNSSVGTSFAAPQVAGVAALMLAGNSGLTPGQLISLIKQSATAFPNDSSLPSCETGTNTDGQCNCTTTTCGAGMLNALAAVSLALKPAANISKPGTATAGASITLDGSASHAAGSLKIVSYSWMVTSGSEIVASFTGTDQAKAVLLPAAAGAISVSLTVTDSNGLTDTTSTTFTVGAAATPTPVPGSSSSNGGGGVLDPLSLIALAALAALVCSARAQGGPCQSPECREKGEEASAD